MCGIYGVIGPIIEPSSISEVAISMGDALKRRGPDNIGFTNVKGGFLGHTRLSLVDLSSAGNQPMQSNKKNIISFNGEIYNFRELRNEINSNFISKTDTEVLLRLIENEGFKKALQICRGMFAVAYYCYESESLFLGRDRLGEKPLYYSFQGNSFIFSSDLKGLVSSNLLNLEMSKEGISEYFSNGFIGAPLSIYEGIYKILPGEYLKVKFANGKVTSNKKSKWFDLADTFKNSSKKLSYDELVNKSQELLSESVSLQSFADAKIGSFLSGGVDSSIVTAMMSEKIGKFDAFTLGSADKRYNESDIAAKFANHLGLSHNIVNIEEINLLEHFDILGEAYSEPLADSSQIPASIISMAATQKVTGVLTGDGGDELFGGYYRYGSGLNTWRLLKKLRYIPFLHHTFKKIEKGLPSNALNFLSHFGIANARDKYRKLSGLASLESLEDYYRKLVSNCLIWDAPYLKRDLVSFEFNLKNLSESNSDSDRLCFWDQSYYLPGDNLAKIDRISMYHSLETRSPFLDANIVEELNSFSYDLKTKKGPKSILKLIQERYYPKSITGSPKRGFSIPLDELMRNELRDWCFEILMYNKHNLFDSEIITELWEEHQCGTNYAPDLWKIICFNRWHENHFLKIN